MKLKSVLFSALSMVLVAALAVGGTLAYLQDEDSDVNVMTLGNVSIEQIEQEWNADKTALQDFTQAKPLYPYVGTLGWANKDTEAGAYRRFTMNNVVDKYVSVKNTGKTDAYVRTIIALEMGDCTYEELGEMIGISINKYNGSEFKFVGAWDWTDDFVAEIDGKNYNIMVAVHLDAVEPGDTTIPSLLQVYMDKDATNETCEKLDGNDNGTYDILVLSQAVQADGFENAATALDTAFGDVTATTAATWFGGEALDIPTTVFTAEELSAALAAGENVVLADDVEAVATAVAPYGNNVGFVQNGGVLDGAGNTLTVIEGSKTYAVMTYGGTIKNLTINSGVRGIVTYTPSEDVIIDNVVIDGPGYAINSAEQSAVNLIVSNSTVNGWTSYGGFTSASFTNCKFGTNTTKYWNNAGYDESYDRLIRPYNATTFTNCEFEKGFTLSLGSLNGAEVIFENCYCNGVKLTAENVATYLTVTDIPSSVIFR